MFLYITYVRYVIYSLIWDASFFFFLEISLKPCSSFSLLKLYLFTPLPLLFILENAQNDVNIV